MQSNQAVQAVHGRFAHTEQFSRLYKGARESVLIGLCNLSTNCNGFTRKLRWLFSTTKRSSLMVALVSAVAAFLLKHRVVAGVCQLPTRARVGETLPLRRPT